MVSLSPLVLGTLSPHRGLRVMALSCLTFSSACGAAPVDRHAAYARIQVAEAQIEHARHEMDGLPSEERSARCASICSAMGDIATDAALLDEADALTRRDRAALVCASCQGTP